MEKVLIVGAGRLGKGFVGETFHEAGWQLTFLDTDQRVIDELNKEKYYTVRVHTVDEVLQHKVTNYKAFMADENYEVLADFLETDLIMCPLYPEDFSAAAEYLASCFDRQFEEFPDSKKTIICLTNKNHIINDITEEFRKNLKNDVVREWFDRQVVVRDSIVRRSTDATSHYATELVTTAVASLIIQGPLYTDLKGVRWLDVRDHVAILKDIKVFTINGPHAATAYLGYLKGYTDILSAQKDKEVAALIRSVHDSTVQAVLYEYPVTRDQIRELEYLPNAKNEMPDAIYRVAFDPIKKVGATDRFMGVIKLCQKYDIPYEGIVTALACAFNYDEKEDPNAVVLKQEIEQKGFRNTVATYIGRKEDDPVVDKIVLANEKLQEKYR